MSHLPSMLPASLLCQYHNIRNTMANAPSLNLNTTGVRWLGARISPDRGVIRCRARILDIALVLTAAKHRTYSYIVCNLYRNFKPFTPTFTAPSIANMGDHKRSGSPDPLPVPPPNYNGNYRDERAHYGDRGRHRSHRRHDHDRAHDHLRGGKVRCRETALFWPKV